MKIKNSTFDLNNSDKYLIEKTKHLFSSRENKKTVVF